MQQSAAALGGAATFKINRAWGAQPDAPDVGVVGAGLAGLACADALAAKGISATVYEARDRPGGRVFSSVPFGFPGDVLERGGEFLDARHTTIRGYARRFNLTLARVDQVPGELLWSLRGQIYTESEIDSELQGFIRNIESDLDDLGRPTALRYTEAERVLDLLSLSEYLQSREASPLVHSVIDVAYNIEYGTAIENQSALTFLLQISGIRDPRFNELGGLPDQKYRVLEGNQAIAAALEAGLFRPTNYEHCLLKISQLGNGRIELVFNVGGQIVTRRHDIVVITIPFSVLRDVEFDSSVEWPEWKPFIISDFDYASNAPMQFVFNGRPWEGYGGNGQLFSDLPDCQHTWVSELSQPPRLVPLLVNYTGGNLAQSVNPENLQEDAERFLRDFESVFPGAGQFARRTAQGNLLVHLEHWPSDPFARGSYTSNSPGYFTTIAGLEAVPVGNLLFAGEHTDSFYDWQGFMEGACNSGIAVAKNILRISRLLNSG